MRREDIIQFWGANNLKRWSEANLFNVLIPALSKSFLTEVGLPFREDWTLRFDPQADGLPRLSSKPGCRRIGFDDVVPICVDEQRDGRVIAVEEDVGSSERFINSNVECFAECLVYYKQYRTAVQLASEAEVRKVIDTSESQMRGIDPAAFYSPNHWWPLIIEQMNQGLL